MEIMGNSYGDGWRMVKPPVCGAGDCGFESRLSPQFIARSFNGRTVAFGAINRGSSPRLADLEKK